MSIKKIDVVDEPAPAADGKDAIVEEQQETNVAIIEAGPWEHLDPPQSILADSSIPGQSLQIILMDRKINAMADIINGLDDTAIKQYKLGKIDAYNELLRFLYNGEWK